MDKDGCIRIVGRIKDIINRGGEKIYPKEIEDILVSHPYIAQASVILPNLARNYYYNYYYF